MAVCCPGRIGTIQPGQQKANPTKITDSQSNQDSRKPIQSGQQTIHLKRISTNCCIHMVVPPDDGPRYARNM